VSFGLGPSDGLGPLGGGLAPPGRDALNRYKTLACVLKQQYIIQYLPLCGRKKSAFGSMAPPFFALPAWPLLCRLGRDDPLRVLLP